MAQDIYELRRANLTKLLDARGKGARQHLALQLDMTPAQVSHWLRAPGRATSRKIHEDSARQIEQALGLVKGALDRDASGPPELTDRENLMLDVMASVTRCVERYNITATREQILQWSRAGYQASLELGHVNDQAIEVLVKYMR